MWKSACPFSETVECVRNVQRCLKQLEGNWHVKYLHVYKVAAINNAMDRMNGNHESLVAAR